MGGEGQSSFMPLFLISCLATGLKAAGPAELGWTEGFETVS